MVLRDCGRHKFRHQTYLKYSLYVKLETSLCSVLLVKLAVGEVKVTTTKEIIDKTTAKITQTV